MRYRLGFIQKWVSEGIPTVFWISGFFFPQAFLTGTLQNYARKMVKPIDAISFSFKVVETPWEEIKERPQKGVYIRGLHLEGARWDQGQYSLIDSRAKELYTSMPVLWLVPEEERPALTENVYKCPVYKTLTRCGKSVDGQHHISALPPLTVLICHTCTGTLSTTGHSTNFVLFVELPTKDPPKKWVKAGVALFCALRY